MDRFRAEAEAIFRAAVEAVDPTALVARHLALCPDAVSVVVGSESVACWRPPTLVIGAGKAAARMAAGCEQILDQQSLRGLVVTAEGCGLGLESIRVVEAGHPLPDHRGVDAAREVIEALETVEAGGVLCLISGGASALLVYPRPPVTLEDKSETTRLLLECGASIGELTTVRKHLSLVKGGGLLRRCRRPVTALILSDVPGDDPGTIGSGPTAVDPTTFTDAQAVLERYGLMSRVPRRVAALLARGAEGTEPETVKPWDAEAQRARNLIIGSNRTALEGAARAAAAHGWAVDIEEPLLVGDTTEAARAFGMRVRERWLSGAARQPACVIAGGETTVRVKGAGRGGRNQEFALVVAQCIAGSPITVLSAGTDGVDGPTPAAGAVVDGQTLHRARARGLDAEAALANNDSNTFFSALGGLVRTGPTGTNVMDIKVALLPAAVPGREPEALLGTQA